MATYALDDAAQARAAANFNNAMSFMSEVRAGVTPAEYEQFVRLMADYHRDGCVFFPTASN